MSFNTPTSDFHPFANFDVDPRLKNASNFAIRTATPWVLEDDPFTISPILKLNLDAIDIKFDFESQSSTVPTAEFDVTLSL